MYTSISKENVKLAVTDAGQQLLVYSIYDPAFSVNETEINNNAIIVFPNPANETITIKFNNSEIVENIKIYNEFGQLVKLPIFVPFYQEMLNLIKQ